MTAFYPVLNSPTTFYTVQAGCGFLDPQYLRSEGSQHPGVDINAATGGNSDLGDPIYAADDGYVLDTGYGNFIGGMIAIRHGDGSTSGYWHARDIHVVKGQRVRGGDMIGQIGAGGPASKMKAHLHFFILKPGVNLPLNYWPSTHHKDHAECARFIVANYEHPIEWLKARGASKLLSDKQAQRPAVTVTHPLPVLPVVSVPSVPPRPPGWERLYDPNMRPIAGEWVHVVRRGAEFRIVRVPAAKVKKAGLS